MDSIRRVVLALVLLAAPARAEILRVPALAFDPEDGIAEVTGKVADHDAVTYGFEAKAGQALRADITSNTGAAGFDVFGPDGGVIAEDDEGMVRLKLEKDGAYAVMVSLVGEADEAVYTLTVELDAADGGAAEGATEVAGNDPAADPEAAVPEDAAAVAGDAEEEAAGTDGAGSGSADEPALFRVAGLGGDPLNLRSRPELGAPVVVQVREGRVLRNLGCQGAGDQRWCRVEAQDSARITGWASARFLVPEPADAADGAAATETASPAIRPRPRP